jgi:hypothetical protein
MFGSRKYAVSPCVQLLPPREFVCFADGCCPNPIRRQSFIFLVSTISTALSLLGMILLQPVVGFNYVPAGSFAIIGAM